MIKGMRCLAVLFAICAFEVRGAVPLAFWDQSFSGTQTGGSQTGCSLTLQTYTAAEGGKVLKRNTLSGSTYGVGITLKEAVSGAVGLTVVVAYSDFQPGDGATMLGYLSMSGAAVLADGTLATRWSDGTTYFGTPSTATFATGTATNFYAFSYLPLSNPSGFRGQRIHVNDDGTWKTVLSTAAYSSGTATMNAIAVGGPGAFALKGDFKLPVEMKIHGIAVFSGDLTDDELSSWEFPSMKKSSVNLAWTQDGSGSWTATQFGDEAYAGEGVHKVDFADSISGSKAPVTVSVDGAREVLDLTLSANGRDFRIEGGSVSAPKLTKSGQAGVDFGSALDLGGGALTISAGRLDLPVGFVFSPAAVGTFSLSSAAALGLRAGTRLSTTNNASLAALSEVLSGSLDLSEGAAFDVVKTNGLPNYVVKGTVSGNGTLTAETCPDTASSVNIQVQPVFTNFNGNLVIRLHGTSGHTDYVVLGAGTSEFVDSWPALAIEAEYPDNSSLLLHPGTSYRPVCCSSLSGNAKIVTSTTGEAGTEIRHLRVGLERDCTFAGGFVQDGNPSRRAYLTVDGRIPGKKLSLSGDNTSTRSTLAVTNGATVVILETGRWQGLVRIEQGGTLELRRAENALGTASLLVDGTLRLVPPEETMTSLSSAEAVAFGADSKLVVEADLSWCPRQTKRFVLLNAPAVVGFPAATVPSGWFVELETEPNGSQSLCLKRRPPGLMLMVK